MFTLEVLIVPVDVVLYVQLELVLPGKALVASIAFELFLILSRVKLLHVSPNT